MRIFRRPMFYAGDFPDFSKTYPIVLVCGLIIIGLSFLLPIDGYLIVIIGLGIDIVGALFIISPLWNQVSRFSSLSFFKRTSGDSNTDDWREKFYIHDDQNKAKLGLSILVLGFLLQILGNSYQYFSSLNLD